MSATVYLDSDQVLIDANFEAFGDNFQPRYERWRHGGWYVTNVRYPSGACGCVSNNYADKHWRIACGPQGITFPSRDAAARAEMLYLIGISRTRAEITPDRNGGPLNGASAP